MMDVTPLPQDVPTSGHSNDVHAASHDDSEPAPPESPTVPAGGAGGRADEAQAAALTPAAASGRGGDQAIVPSAWILRRSSIPGLAFDLLLIALIAIGVIFRFSWSNWNQDTDLHPDEYGLTSTLTQLSIPKSLGDYFNTRISLMSPYQKYDAAGRPIQPSQAYPMPDNRLRWGQWPLIIIRWTAEVTGSTGYRDLRLMGRHLSALADSLALAVIFLIGAALFSRRVGLLATALSALAVMQIQQSHFMTVDNFAVLFTLLTMYCAVRVAKGGSWTWYALFGIFFGMALASRINLAPLAAEVVVATFIAYADQWTKHKKDLLNLATEAGLRLALSGAAAFLTFRVTQPMTFRAASGDTTILTLHLNPEWSDSLAVAQAESSGLGGGPPAEQWTNRPALIFPWINMVVWGLGLPLGLMAWAGLLWAIWRTFKSNDDVTWRQHLLPLTWAGGYFLFMGTRWVKSIRYFLPIYPFMALFAAWAIVALWQWRSSSVGSEKWEVGGEQSYSHFPRLTSRFQLLAIALGAVVLGGTLAWAWGYTSIYRTDNTRIQATRWMFQNISGPFNLAIATSHGQYREPLPAPDGLTIRADIPYQLQFTSQVTGTLTTFALGYARSPNNPKQTSSLHVILAADAGGTQLLAQTDVTVPPAGADPRGEPASVAFGPAALEMGKTYYLFISVANSGPVEVHGATVADESWDESLPLRLDGRDPFGGLYTGLTMEVRWQDTEDKRQMFYNILSQTDYVIVPSQRAVWAASRLPNTYPMTDAYYKALFDGRLGFDLVQQFQSPIILGPLQISDAAGTWAWGRPPPNPPPKDYPFNNNILAAEEAFSVYDHAPVWIFKKRPDFNLAQVQAVLNAIDLTTVVNQGPLDATKTPTLLRLPADRLAAQTAGGTWSQIFDFNALLNRYEWLGVVVWYLTILLMGWLAMPLAFAAFGGLADRGYALTRALALLVATWLVWITGSFQILPFTRGTILLALLVVACASGLVYWRQRAEINAWLRVRRRYILAVESLFLALFGFDLLIRLGNPDLWHPNFGGEKPMVFSFFNAVLKSTSFPPYNPWLAGHFLNYYYYGFLIVALPVKLLGIVPAFAYNLVLPTLFAMLGVNAFCVAFNLIAAGAQIARKDEGQVMEALEVAARTIVPGFRTGKSDVGGGDGEAKGKGESPAAEQAVGGGDAAGVGEWVVAERAKGGQVETPTSRPEAGRIAPNPYIAGMAAALLVVVLGNLGQIYVVLTGFQKAADHAALATSFLGDNGYSAALDGFWRVASGQTHIPIGTGDWYWTATRIVTELNKGGSEITEFPFFTFLYADLHAHMIDMPFMLLSLAWAVSYVLLAAQPGGGRRRSWLEWTAVWVVGGLALGAARATNTWDFPLFLTLGVLAVIVGEWLREPGLSRAKLFNIGWRVVLLLALAFAFYRPFDYWFAAAYSQVKRYTDTPQPISAYLYIYGLFLFIVVSFLAMETRRWLAETPASVLTHAGDWLLTVGLVVLAFVVVMAVFWYLAIPIALITVPLMAWAGLLLLRSRGSMPIEKRLLLFLLGTALAVTLFVELFTLEGDRMNTIFKFYIQVWLLLSVVGGAALAWLLAALPEWTPGWRGGWTAALAVLVGGAALYTVTATAAKVSDRFPSYTASATGAGCAPLPGMVLPDRQGLPLDQQPHGLADWLRLDQPAPRMGLAPAQQPHSLYGLDYMTWSAFCDRDTYLPLSYDYAAIRWMQDNVQGSPVIAEAQSFDLYHMSSRYTWNTGLPDVVGWDYHTRQHNAAIPTQFITDRGNEIISFYTGPDLQAALGFIHRYAVRYVVVGPMERAFYGASGGLAKFDALVSRGALSVAYRNPGVTIYAVTGPAASQ